jgi:hypothetical protein
MTAFAMFLVCVLIEVRYQRRRSEFYEALARLYLDRDFDRACQLCNRYASAGMFRNFLKETK